MPELRMGEVSMTNRRQEQHMAVMAAVNEVIEELHHSLGLPDSDFFCECADIGCRERITLTRDEFARLRSESLPIVVAAHAHRIVFADEVLELHDKVRKLQEALDSRVIIEQAKGVLAQQSGVTLDTAFEILRHRAREQRRSLGAVCAETVAIVETEGRESTQSPENQQSLQRSDPRGS